MKLNAYSNWLIALALLPICMIVTGCRSAGPNATAGGLFGGATGGLLGAAIGSHEGKSTEGALLGAATGLAAGSLLGKLADRHESALQQREAEELEIARQSAISMDDVVQMTSSGLSDEVIANQIQSQGVNFQLSTDDLIFLKSNHVSDRVIAAIQSSPPIGSQNATAPGWYRQPREIHVVEPAVIVEPCPWVVPGPRIWRDSRCHSHRPLGSHFEFSYGF